MAKTQFGTDTITGLNVGTAPHKIQPHELQASENGWTEQEGAWRVAKSPERLYSGYTDISAFASGRMGGADHLVWIDDDKLYDNGSEIGAITEGASMKIVALDDKFLILGAAVNYLYDGDHIREQGTWQPERMAMRLSKWTPVDQGPITAITKANPGVVTMAAHELETEDWVWLSDITGMTELNDRQFQVTRLTASTFSINEDTTDHTLYVSGGKYNRKAGLDGVYKFYMTCTLELDNGTVLESRPRGLAYNSTDDSRDSWEAEEIVLTATDGIDLDKGTNYSMVWWNFASTDLFDISGVRGTDYKPGMRIYRTKADGADFYLEREWRHGDSNFIANTGGTSIVYYPEHDGTSSHGAFFGAPDRELGAVYTASATDHGLPPVSSHAVTVGQRLFLNDTSHPNRYWWSHLDGIEYYNPLGWNLVPDAVTSLSQLDEKLVVTSQDRLFVDYFSDGLPNFHEVRTDTGSVTGITCTTDDGVLFLEEDGLWLFAGGKEHFLPYAEFPWFSDARVTDVLNVELLHEFHLPFKYWQQVGWW